MKTTSRIFLALIIMVALLGSNPLLRPSASTVAVAQSRPGDPPGPEPTIAVDAIPGGAIDNVLNGLNVGATFDVDVVAQNIASPGLDSVSYELVYDQTVIKGTSVAAGPMVAGMTVTISNPDTDPAQSLGRAKFTCAFAAAPVSGPTGNGVLTTISFSVEAIGHSGVVLQDVSVKNISGANINVLSQNANLSAGVFQGLNVPPFGVDPSPAADGLIHAIGPISVGNTSGDFDHPQGFPITITQVIAGAGLLLSPPPSWVKYAGATPSPSTQPQLNTPISEIVWSGSWTLPGNGSNLQPWSFAVKLDPGHVGESLDLHARVVGTGPDPNDSSKQVKFSVSQAVDRPISPCGGGAGKCLSGIVRDGIGTVNNGVPVFDGHSNLLKGATVELRHGGTTVAGPVATDQVGAYRFSGLAAGNYQVRATLEDGESASQHIFEVRYRQTADEPVWIEHSVTILTSDAGPNEDLIFTRDEAITDSNISELRWFLLDDIANIFFRTRQYVDWLKTTLNPVLQTTNRQLPVEIYAFSEETPAGSIRPLKPLGAFYRGSDTAIHLGTEFSLYKRRRGVNNLAPENGEWHEFTHHIFHTNITETGCPGSNHGGRKNPDTCDSFNEGLAAFLPALASQSIDGVADSMYAGIANLEDNIWKSWTFAMSRSGDRFEREDLAVAALLWDLVDSNDDTENTQILHFPGFDFSGTHRVVTYKDKVALPVQTLWSIIAAAKPKSVAALRDAIINSPLVAAPVKERSIDIDGDTAVDISLLDVPFLLHGFFPVNPNYPLNDAVKENDNAHGHYMSGTPVGRTDYIDADGSGPGTALIERRNTPLVPTANLRINVRDPNGNPSPGAIAVLTIVSPESTDIIERLLDNGTENLEPLELPPYFRGPLPEGQPLPACDSLSDYIVRVTVTVMRNGIVSPQQFQFDNCQYAHAIAQATDDFALEFTFTLPEGNDNQPPSVSLNAPAGGEILQPGNQFTVSWISSDDTGVTSHDILFSTNGGASFSTIATGLGGAQHSFNWTVPGVLTNQARIRLIARDAAGNTGQATSGDFSIRDTAPPVITSLSVDKSVLWPPNHKMVDLTVSYGVTDNFDPVSVINCTLSVTSNEPINGTGDGDKAPDWEIVDAHHLRLRAERAGTGSGRTYTINITCTDSSGNSSSRNIRVNVPLSR